MNDDTINDLKQFIAATVHQEVTGIVDGLEGRLQSQISNLDTKIVSIDKKIDDKAYEILSAIADTTGDRFETVEEDIKSIDTRVTKLESKAALST